MAVDSNIENWNVADPSGSLGPTVWAMGSVLPYAFSVAPDFTPTLNTDLLADARPTTPTTVTYTVQPTARWDDGTPVGVDDFTLIWRLRNGRDCPDCPGEQAGYDRISAITGSPTPDGGSTVLVTFDQPYPDWATLFSSTDPLYPAHLAARQGDLGTPAGLRAAFDWFGATVPTYSAGPLAVQSWQPDQALVLTRNPRWYGRPARLDRVVLQVMADPAAQVQALRENRVQVIAPNARAGLAEQLAGQADVAARPGRQPGLGAVGPQPAHPGAAPTRAAPGPVHRGRPGPGARHRRRRVRRHRADGQPHLRPRPTRLRRRAGRHRPGHR